MRRSIPFAIVLLYSFTLPAQESKWSITFTPAIVQSPDLRFGIQPGAEYRFNDRFSLLTEVTFVSSGSKSINYSNGKYFRIKPELRYQLAESPRGLKTYVGFQLSYTHRSWQNDHTGCYFNQKFYTDTVIGYDRAHISSPILTGSFQLGTPFSFGDHFGMDLFMGLGMRVIFTSYSRVENTVTKYYMPPVCKIVPAPDPAFYVNGTIPRFHCNFGCRLFYRF